MKLKKLDKRWIWIGLGALAMLTRWLLGYCPSCTEQWYSQGIFLGIRNIIDYTVALSPVALVYFFFPILLFVTFRRIRRSFQKEMPVKQRLGSTLLSIGAFVFGVIFFFLVLWGYNYGRVQVEEHMGFEAPPVKVSEIKSELDYFTDTLSAIREGSFSNNTLALDESFLSESIEKDIRAEMIALLQSLDYPTPGRVRGRILKPKGILLRFSTAGVYFPWTGECHIDGGLHPLQIPFVLAHELAHGYGFTDEGSCNFLAFLACAKSNNTFVKYSGYLNYWRYLAGEYRYYYPKEYPDFRAALPQGIQNDLNAINETMRKYPDILPKLRYYAYETYLKAQGIDEGMKNYNRVIMLVTGYRKNNLIMK